MNYLETKNGRIFYNKLDLQKLAKQYGTPTKLVFLDIIENQIKFLKNTFQKAIKSQHYNGNFVYLNANKANYNAEIVFTAAKFCDGIETSSHFDLEMTDQMQKTFPELKKPVVLNGFKTKEYLQKLVSMHLEGTKVLDIVDDLTEVDFLLAQKFKTPMEIGVRINLEGIYGHSNERDRFGLTEKDIKELKQKLKGQNKLKLTTVHFHQRGFNFEQDKFYENIEKACNKYAELKKDFTELKNLDIGGGTPWAYDNSFDYQTWANGFILFLKNFFDAHKIEHPNILSENGKYTVKDSIVNLYEVIGEKKTNQDFSWYLLNTSIMVAIPELFICSEPMKILPINNLEEAKTNVKLAGITCDCDDVFEGKTEYLEFPKLTGKKQIVGIFGTGSYQESLTSQKGIRHCLIQSEKRVVTFLKDKKRNFVVVEERDTAQDIFGVTKLNKTYLKQFN